MAHRFPSGSTVAVALLAACGATAAAWIWGRRDLIAANRSVNAAEILGRVRSVSVTSPMDAEFLDGRARYTQESRLSTRTPKVHLRSERRYFGPQPTPRELDCLVRSGLSDGLYPHLRADLRLEVSDGMRPIEAEAATIAHDLDAEIEAAKEAVHGSTDEVVIDRNQPGGEALFLETARRTERADKARERWFHASRGMREHYYRLTQDRWPRIFELIVAQESTLRLRTHHLEALMRECLGRHGVAALDAASFPPEGRR